MCKIGVAQVGLIPLFLAHLAEDRVPGAIRLSIEAHDGGAKLGQVPARWRFPGAARPSRKLPAG